MEDLYQIGCIGFIKAVKRFDTSFDVKLSTYAVPYMIGEIKRFIRDDGLIKVSRSIKELRVKIKEIQKTYIVKKGREITLKELEQELKVGKEDIILAMESMKNVESFENATYVNGKNGNSISIKDKITTGKDEEEIITNKMVVKELINTLAKREKDIILLRFFKGKTQTEVAKMIGITQVQVSRIEKKILNKMKLKLIS